MRVAVVDDDPRLRELLAAELEDGGCTVLRCGDGGELLAAQRAGSLADVELVLLDWMMPRLDGLACLRQLRAVITALCDPAQRQAALDAGANDYVLKTALLDGVERLLTR
jgi:DNA-binding response OmpR family regulator